MKQDRTTGTLKRLFTRAATLVAGFAFIAAPPAAVPAHDPAATTDFNFTVAKGWNPPRSSIVIDFDTGTVLSQSKPDELRHPASLAKVMTLMLAFDALRDGRLTPGQKLTVSAHAAARAPVKLGLKAGSTIAIEDAMRLVATKSTNDMAAVIAEAIGGTEDQFAVLMTQKAHSLGMTNTVFKNASGLPDPAQVTTARDMAVMTRHLIAQYSVEYAQYMGKRSVVYNKRTYTATNRMLGTYPGMDGVKTGYINASGFNLIASATRKDRRIIGVIFGGTSAAGRDASMALLLDAGFKAVATIPKPAAPPANDNPAPAATVQPAAFTPRRAPPGIPLPLIP